MYLPPEAQDRLFDAVTALSAPGSRLATEYHPDGGAVIGERTRALREQWSRHGLDDNVPEVADLFYPGERTPPADYLTRLGLARQHPPAPRGVRRLRTLLRRRRSAGAAARLAGADGGAVMTRTDGDTWDLASSVGATATSVAASRAFASRGPDPLIADPYAELLVEAVGVPHFVAVARR